MGNGTSSMRRSSSRRSSSRRSSSLSRRSSRKSRSLSKRRSSLSRKQSSLSKKHLKSSMPSSRRGSFFSRKSSRKKSSLYNSSLSSIKTEEKMLKIKQKQEKKAAKRALKDAEKLKKNERRASRNALKDSNKVKELSKRKRSIGSLRVGSDRMYTSQRPHSSLGSDRQGSSRSLGSLYSGVSQNSSMYVGQPAPSAYNNSLYDLKRELDPNAPNSTPAAPTAPTAAPKSSLPTQDSFLLTVKGGQPPPGTLTGSSTLSSTPASTHQRNNTFNSPAAGATTATNPLRAPAVPRNASSGSLAPPTDAANADALHKVTKQYDNSVHAIAIRQTTNPAATLPENTFAEILQFPFVLANSGYLNHLVERVHCGHTAAVVALCGSGNAGTISIAERVTLEVMNGILQKLELTKNQNAEQFKMRMSAALLSSTMNTTGAPSTSKDLLGFLSSPKPTIFGTNPVYGKNIMNLTEKSVSGAADVNGKVKKCVKKFKTSQGEMLYLQFKITQVRSQGDVYATAMTFLLVNNGKPTFNWVTLSQRIAEKKDIGILMRDLTSGATRTAVVVPVCDQDFPNREILDNNTCKGALHLASVEGKASHSGSLKSFVEWTQRRLTSFQNPIEKAAVEKFLASAQKTLAAPMTNHFISLPVPK